MKCVECGERLAVVRENRRYTEAGLPQVTLAGVEVRRCPACGAEELVIPRIEQLHQAIARALIRKPARLAGPEIRFLRTYIGWSGTDFAKRMGTARETVSRWEKDVARIGAQADRLLRLLVATTAPVEDYSAEELTQIAADGDPAPARLAVASRAGSWQVKAA